MQRRLPVFLLVAGLLIGPALLPALLANPSYDASATISIERAPEVLKFGAEVVPEQQFVDRRQSIAGVNAVILSNRVLGVAVDRSPPPPPSEPGLFDRIGTRISELLGRTPASEPSPELKRQLAIEALRGRISIEDAGAGSVIKISISDRDPGRATALANTIADSYVQFERDRRHAASRQALSWLRTRSAELREQILRQQAAVSGLAEELGPIVTAEGPTSSDGEGSEAREQLARLQSLRAELLATDQRLAELRPSLAQIQQPAVENVLTAKRAVLERELNDARLLLTPSHPELRRLERALEDLDRMITEQPPAARQSNPLALEHAREHDRLRSQRLILQARVDSLEKQLGAGDSTDTTDQSRQIAQYHRMSRELELDQDLLSTIQQRISSTVLTASQESGGARVLDYALLPMKTSSARLKWLLLGLGLALGGGFGVALLTEMADQAEYDPNGAAAALGTDLLAKIPAVDPDAVRTPRAALEYTTPLGESMRKLRTSLLYMGLDQDIKTLLIASAVSGEGKTTTATFLAASIASIGRKTLLLDADMRRPQVDRIVGLPRSPGLSEVLRGREKAADVIQHPRTFGADVITSGEIPDNPTDLLSERAMGALLEELSQQYDVVIVDSPVLLAVSDSLLLSASVDAVALVNRPGAVGRRALDDIAHDLRRAGARVLGLIATQVMQSDRHAYPSYLSSPYISSGRRSRILGIPIGRRRR